MHQIHPSPHPLPNAQALTALYALALVKTQTLIDEQGYISCPYPFALQRAFNLGAACNSVTPYATWPTDLDQLMAYARQPLNTWAGDMSWDTEGAWQHSCLLEGAEISSDCRHLAHQVEHPALELEENSGFQLLMHICHNRPDGQKIYQTWRRLVIEKPVLPSYTAVLADPLLATIERIDELVQAFYQPVSAAFALNGQLPLCSVSGTVLRKLPAQGTRLSKQAADSVFHTEYRAPEAVRRARAGLCDYQPYHPALIQLRRAFRTYWCFPGKTELYLQQRLALNGWHTVLWPDFDRIDLLATSPNGRSYALEVKDYISPGRLAKRFDDFKEFAQSHTCYLVVPDHLTDIDLNFKARFNAFRAACGKQPVQLLTASQLLATLGQP